MLHILFLQLFFRLIGRKDAVDERIQLIVVVFPHFANPVKQHGRLPIRRDALPLGKIFTHRCARPGKGQPGITHLLFQPLADSRYGTDLHLIRIVEEKWNIGAVPGGFSMLEWKFQYKIIQVRAAFSSLRMEFCQAFGRLAHHPIQ